MHQAVSYVLRSASEAYRSGASIDPLSRSAGGRSHRTWPGTSAGAREHNWHRPPPPAVSLPSALSVVWHHCLWTGGPASGPVLCRAPHLTRCWKAPFTRPAPGVCAASDTGVGGVAYAVRGRPYRSAAGVGRSVRQGGGRAGARLRQLTHSVDLGVGW